MTDFFQTAAWTQFQRDLGSQLLTAAGDGWHYTARVQKDSVGSYLYLAGGPVVRDINALDTALHDLRDQAKSVGAYRAIIEPTLPIAAADLESRAARRVRGFRHSRTQAVNLDRPWDEVFAELSTSRRKQFRGAEKRGMEFSESTSRDDFDTFLALYRAQGDAGAFEVRNANYFDVFYTSLIMAGAARMFVARQHGKVEVIGIVIDDADSSTRYYLYVGRDLGNNSLQISSPFITWMMRDAHERGLKTFDLFGISESDEVEDETTGYTVFKRTFGGDTVAFAGTWEIKLSELKYGAYRIAQSLKSQVRR